MQNLKCTDLQIIVGGPVLKILICSRDFVYGCFLSTWKLLIPTFPEALRLSSGHIKVLRLQEVGGIDFDQSRSSPGPRLAVKPALGCFVLVVSVVV